jgi:hypothetical protein
MDGTKETSERIARYGEYSAFLKGGDASRTFFCLDPSSFASLYAGKQYGSPSLEALVAFHLDFSSDAGVSIPVEFGKTIPGQVAQAVQNIRKSVSGRRHIVGQADATILAGMPPENIRSFIDASNCVK